MEYELVDSDLRLVLLPKGKVAEFAARLPGATKATPGNLRALLMPEAQNSAARLGWEANMVKGMRVLAAVKWIQLEGNAQSHAVPVPDWDVAGWIERVPIPTMANSSIAPLSVAACTAARMPLL